jgi:lysozyme
MSTPAKLPTPDLPWPLIRAGVELIATREGCRLAAYQCVAGIWTCGWGETDGVTPRTRWTQAYADERFCDALTERTDQVLALCTAPPSDSQLAAMVSLHYNVGHAAFAKSSVLRAHNRGDTQAAARAFGLWNKARVNGQLQVVAGLTARRAAESALYLTPDPDAAPDPMPQAVAPESTLAASPINRTGALVAGSGVLAMANEVQQSLGPVGATLATTKTILTDSLGIAPGLVLPIVLVAAGAAVMWWRHRQRRDGWA